MSKYNLRDLMEMSVLPVDCNQEAEDYARKFVDAGLMVMMKKFREKAFCDGYGEATHLGEGGSPEVIFAFTAGICKHASVLVWIDSKNVAKGSKKFY